MKDFNDYLDAELNNTVPIGGGLSADQISDLNTRPAPESSAERKPSEFFVSTDGMGGDSVVPTSAPKPEMISDNDYFNMKDPETNQHYVIPMLSPSSEGYRDAYIAVMKIKVTNPEIFDTKIMKFR